MPTNASYDDVYKARWLKSDDLPDEDTGIDDQGRH